MPSRLNQTRTAVDYLLESALAGTNVMPEEEPAPRGFFARLKGLFADPEVLNLEKSVKVASLRLQEKMLVAAESGTTVSEQTDAWASLENSQGIRQPSGVTFRSLRRLAASCEPLSAIVSTLVDQVAAFSRPAKRHRGHYSDPGWVITMTDSEETATPEDLKNFKIYSQFIQTCGWADPPTDEKPPQWQKGFEPFLRAITRDRLTLDWIAVRTWPSESDPKKYPVVAFAAVDSALIRKRRRIIKEVRQFNLVTEEAPVYRTNTKEEITVVRVQEDTDVVTQEFSDDQIFTAFARVRTDETANGYGYAESEECLNAISMWNEAREYNATRFSKNSLPRGILSILGNVSEAQMGAFRKQWKQMVQGLDKAWNIPIVSGRSESGSSVKFDPIDLSPKDMENSQTLFIVSNWLHSNYGISPEETGYAATNPFNPPLSEASPESTLTHSQERALHPLLRFIEDTINHNLIWRIDPSHRYTFQFVGMGEHNELDDVQAATARLATGLSTPEEEWAERDLILAPEVANHPASKLPMPWADGVMFLQQLAQGAAQSAAGATPGAPGEQGQGGAPGGGGSGQDENGDEQEGDGQLEQVRQGELARQQSVKLAQSSQVSGGAKPPLKPPISPGSKLTIKDSGKGTSKGAGSKTKSSKAA